MTSDDDRAPRLPFDPAAIGAMLLLLLYMF